MPEDAAPTITYPFDAPAPGDVVEVAPGIHWVRLPLPMALDHVNAWALADDDGWTLVDPGIDTRKVRAMWDAALAGPLSDRGVARVLVTHHHPDHVGLAGWFQAAGAELLMPRTGWLLARMMTLDEQPRPTAETLAFWRAAGMAAEIYDARAIERPFNFADCVHPMPLGYRRLVDGDVLSLAGRDWTIRMGAGHAPEHATLWSDDLVLGGDQLLPSISPNIGLYATEPEADPLADWLAACDRLAPHARADQLVLPGHKLPYRGLPLRLRQLAENHHGALDRLRAHLDTPRTAGDCFVPLFGREIGRDAYGLALNEAMAHCVHLWHRSEVTRTRRNDGAWLWQRAGTA